MKYVIIGLTFLLYAVGLAAMGDADPAVTKINVHKFELVDVGDQLDSETPLAWEAEASWGHDQQKWLIKTEGEWADGDTEDLELELRYSRAWTANWDWQLGWRGNLEPSPERHWLAIVLAGEAPYGIEFEAGVFLGKSGRTAFEIKAEHEWMLTQRWVVMSELEMLGYGKNDDEAEVGSGLSDLELSVRLGYEVSRQLVPYIGLSWEKSYGKTADFSVAAGDDREETVMVAGLHFWF